MAPTKANNTNLSASELKLFAAIMQYTTTDPVCDWTAVAEAAGYKDAANAKTMYRRFKKAVVERTGAGVVIQSSTPISTPKAAKTTPSRRKRQATSDSEEDRAPSPTSKSSRPTRKLIKVSHYNDLPSDNEDISAGRSGSEETEIKKHGRSSKNASSRLSGKPLNIRASKPLDKDQEEETTVESSTHEGVVNEDVKEESRSEASHVAQLDDDIA